MANTNLTVYDLSIAGIDLTANKTTIVTADTYYIPSNDGRVKLYIKNAVGTTLTLTIETPGTDADGNAIADKTFTLATAKEAMVGPFKTTLYNDAQDRVKLTFDKAVDVVAVRG